MWNFEGQSKWLPHARRKKEESFLVPSTRQSENDDKKNVGKTNM